MEFTEELKSQFPIGKLSTAPLLQSSSSILGPLAFNPNPESLTLISSSQSLCHHFLSPPSQLSLSRFLSTSSLPPTSSSIASQFNGTRNETLSDQFYNRLQILHCPLNNTVIAFFPTGYNNDQIGFLVISYKHSRFDVLAGENNTFFTVKNRGRICGILVNPVEDIEDVSDVGGCYILDQSVFFIWVDDIHDRHRDKYLDVDDMSYEELLALEERIWECEHMIE